MRLPGRMRTLLALAGLAVLAAVATASLLMSGFPVAATPEPTPTATATPSASPALPRPTPAPRSPSPSATPEAPRRMTLLVLGSDSDAARITRGSAPLTDSIIVASVSADRARILLVSIPRDTVDVPMADGSIWKRKINSMYAVAGIDAVHEAVETMLGVPIDHHVLLNMDEFAGLVDALGGLEVDVPFPIQDPIAHLSISSGPQHMTGDVVLKYVRNRSLDGDYGRSARQHAVLIAMARNLADQDRVSDPLQVLRSLQGFVTDMELDDLAGVVELVRESRGAALTSMVLKPPDFAISAGNQGSRGWVIIPDVVAMRTWIADALGD